MQVSEKLRLGAKTAVDIERFRDGYRPAAKRGAILFFVLADLSSVNTMYQYSLSAYLDVFQYSLRRSLPDSILQQRLENMMDTLTLNIYNYGCTGALVSGGRDEVGGVVVRSSVSEMTAPPSTRSDCWFLAKYYWKHSSCLKLHGGWPHGKYNPLLIE